MGRVGLTVSHTTCNMRQRITNMWRAYAVISLLVVGLSFGWYQSHLSTKIAEQNAQTEKDKAEAVVLQLSELKTTNAKVNLLLAKYQTTKKEVEYVDRIVTKEVIRYRDAVPNRCLLSGMWVNTYNLSTTYQTDTPTGTDGATGAYADHPVDDAIALEVATFNNRQCVREKERLSALQQWAQSF